MGHRKRTEARRVALDRPPTAGEPRIPGPLSEPVPRSGYPKRGDLPGGRLPVPVARFDDSAITLTDQGLAFSLLENPILDKRDKKAMSPLAEEESSFLVEQILEWVPAERDDMLVVLNAVGGGSKTPSELTGAIRGCFPQEWSDSVFQTHTSGLVARLGELRLLKRVWHGRNVNYELGDEYQVETFLWSETKE